MVTSEKRMKMNESSVVQLKMTERQTFITIYSFEKKYVKIQGENRVKTTGNRNEIFLNIRRVSFLSDFEFQWHSIFTV